MEQTLPSPEELETLIADDEEIRIDKLLSLKFPNHSRTYFQHLIEMGCVLINGKPIKKRIIPNEGDEIEVCFIASPEASIAPEEIPLEILYEDEHLLAINKPAGMVVHPAPGNWSGTFVNALLAHCKGCVPGDDPIRPGIVHRLDKETSGVLLAAKTISSHKKLIELFSNRKIEKLYLAICHGKPPNGVIDKPIGRHPVKRKEMCILPDGKEALTEINVAAFNEKYSLVIAKPKTGRTHQIRVHLKHLNAPVLGDSLYGKKEDSRHLLHAYKLQFEHPITKEPMKLIAPIPQDMVGWIQKLSTASLLSPSEV